MTIKSKIDEELSNLSFYEKKRNLLKITKRWRVWQNSHNPFQRNFQKILK
jgi:hypothetical protein